MFFYCESKNHKGIVVLDVQHLEDLKQVWDMLVQEEYDWEQYRTASLIQLNHLEYEPYQGPREGRWYSLDKKFWGNFTLDVETIPLDTKNPHILFRMAATYRGNKMLNFKEYQIADKELIINDK